MRAFFVASFTSGLSIYWTLLRITVPLLLAVRLLDEHFNLIARTGDLLSPLMALVGLPGDAAIVIATALFLQIYAALLVLFGLGAQLELSVAQSTILMTMILIAHALPVELRIVQKAGMPMRYAAALRLGGAFLLGALLNLIYGDTYLQQPAALPFAATEADDSWGAWLTQQARNWAVVFVIVLALTTFVNLLRVSHAERFLIWLLAPLLRALGIGERAVTLTMIGMLLGLSYGGGMLIQQSKHGGIARRDVLCALSLLCLCHSVVEDTLLVMAAADAHLSGVFFGRVLFSFVVMIAVNKLLRPDRPAHPNAPPA